MNQNVPTEWPMVPSRVPLGQHIRRLQVRIEDMGIEHKRLRSELDRTKAELELVTGERNRAVDRLQRAGLI